eukprot:Platyproteum_vivax@DN2712_c0_g1_i1.p1
MEALLRLPPVTKFYVTATVILTLLVSFDVLSPFSLYLNWNLIMKQFQVWRVITCFLYIGQLNLSLLWHIYILVLHCSNLEEASFGNDSASFLWMLIVSITMLLGLSVFTGNNTAFFGECLFAVISYLWGRRNPRTEVWVFMFRLRAPYIVWILLLLRIAEGGSFYDYLMGLLVGHVYYFFTDIYPYMPTSKGFKLFQTPSVLTQICSRGS